MIRITSNYLGTSIPFQTLFKQTVESIRYSMETGLSNIFLIGTMMTFLSFLIICAIPGSSMGSEVNSG